MASSPAAAQSLPTRRRHTTNPSPYPLEGSCICKYLRYRMITKPLIVHCCHCKYCQRESGSAFAINAMIEANRIVHYNDTKPVLHKVPSESGHGQTSARCPKCNFTVWSNFHTPLVRYVKVGTLDNPAACTPDVHIFTKSKQPWVKLPEEARVFERTYEDKHEVWDKESLDRWEIFEEKVRVWEEKRAREQEQAGKITDRVTDEKASGEQGLSPNALNAAGL